MDKLKPKGGRASEKRLDSVVCFAEVCWILHYEPAIPNYELFCRQLMKHWKGMLTTQIHTLYVWETILSSPPRWQSATKKWSHLKLGTCYFLQWLPYWQSTMCIACHTTLWLSKCLNSCRRNYLVTVFLHLEELVLLILISVVLWPALNKKMRRRITAVSPMEAIQAVMELRLTKILRTRTDHLTDQVTVASFEYDINTTNQYWFFLKLEFDTSKFECLVVLAFSTTIPSLLLNCANI